MAIQFSDVEDYLDVFGLTGIYTYEMNNLRFR